MPKKCLLLVCALLLGGCALPLPVQIASWAIDGLLVITTEKTMTDHGVSLVARKDCALWRGVTEGAVCRDGDAATAVAFADLAPPAFAKPAAYSAEAAASAATAGSAGEASALVGDDEAARLASFETAAGENSGSVRQESIVTVSEPNEGAITVSASWQAIVEAAMFIAPAPEPVAPEAMCDAPTTTLVAEEPETRPAEESLAQEDTPSPALETMIATEMPDAAVELAMLFAPAPEPVAPEAMCDAPAVSLVAAEPAARPEAEERAQEPTPAPLVEAVIEIETLEPAIELATAAMPWPAEAMAAPAPDDHYYVVGTFMEWPKALAFAERHALLEPTILSARLDGRRLYRIAVGPVEPLAQKTARQRLRAHGLIDVWTARMAPETWSIVATTGPPDRRRAQVAEIWPPPLAER